MQTTPHHLLFRNSTALRNEEATTRMNMRAWSQILAPLPLPLHHIKMSAMQNQIESRAKNIITVTKKGTEMRNSFSKVQR